MTSSIRETSVVSVAVDLKEIELRKLTVATGAETDGDAATDTGTSIPRSPIARRNAAGSGPRRRGLDVTATRGPPCA